MFRVVNVLLLYLLQVHSCKLSGFKIVKRANRTLIDFPYVAKLERVIILSYSGKVASEEHVHICTSTVLSPMWSVTAGHCIDSAGPVRQLTNNIQIKTIIRYGGKNDSTADVISSIYHPDFVRNGYNLENDIGLVRTEIIRIWQYPRLSSLDVTELGGQHVTLISHGFFNDLKRRKFVLKRKIEKHRRPVQVLDLLIVRSHAKNTTEQPPAACLARRCIPSITSTCSSDSGGPIIHTSGLVGLNSLSLENLIICSMVNNYSLIDIKVITPVAPYADWINLNIKRDTLIF